MFPEDLGDFYFSMDFYDYRNITDRKSDVSEKSTLDPLRRLYNADKTSVQNQIAKPSSFARIKLPIPNNLKDVFKVNYESTQFGAAIGAGAALQSIGENVFDPSNTSGIFSQFEEIGGEATAAATRGVAGWVTSKGMFFNSNLSGLWDATSGVAVNPNLAILFRGPTLKSHQFEWTLTPRTKKESESLKTIKAIVTRAMHPERLSTETSAMLRFPSECLIQFIGRKPNGQFLYPLRPTVVENASFDYASNGVVSFFQDTDETTSMRISISFQETSYYTRDSFDDQTQYGSDGFTTEDLTGGTNAFGDAS